MQRVALCGFGLLDNFVPGQFDTANVKLGQKILNITELGTIKVVVKAENWLIKEVIITPVAADLTKVKTNHKDNLKIVAKLNEVFGLNDKTIADFELNSTFEESKEGLSYLKISLRSTLSISKEESSVTRMLNDLLNK